MSDLTWEALAEVYISPANTAATAAKKEFIFCLCSRALLKNQQDVTVFEQEELSEAYDRFNELALSSGGQKMSGHRVVKDPSQEEEDSDANSCYFSASASHTDNYCTTDEHERDSGADISECHGSSGRMIFKRIHRDRDETKTSMEWHRERNNSLPEVFGIKELNNLWEKHWSENGEQLIWFSWIEKYSDYINPTFKNFGLPDDDVSTIVPEMLTETASEGQPAADTEIFVSSCSPGAIMPEEAMQSGDAPLRDLMDSLLIPRCDSVTSSIPLTIGTTDSMTNVTHMTCSSYGFTDSPHPSDDSPLSESSPSSMSSPGFDDGDETKIECLHEDSGDQHWQALWQQHFQQQYSHHYNAFMNERRPSKCHMSSSFQDDELGAMANAASSGSQSSNMTDGRTVVDEENDGEEEPEEEMSFMADLGLPTAFGKTNKNYRKSQQRISEECSKDRVRGAFSLMGFAFENQSARTNGHVVYRKKNIRLHNQDLKMKRQRADGDGQQGKDENVLEMLADDSSDDNSPPVSFKVDAVMGMNEQPSGRVTEEAAEEKDECQSSRPVEAETEPQDEPTTIVTVQPNGGAVKKSKKKRRPNKMQSRLPPEIANDRVLSKYWLKRFSLFSLFDQGIRLDRESWFSVTPEKIAAYTAERCRCDIVVDAFCGAGGNTIQFAKQCRHVIAIDIDPKKIEMARHNAGVYGVADRIEFIVGDFFKLAPTITADVVFLSPPWGGPEYLKSDVYDIEAALQPCPASQLMASARQISSDIAIFLPRNSNTQQLAMLAGPGNSVELEQSFLNRRLIAITAFYGNLVKNT